MFGTQYYIDKKTLQIYRLHPYDLREEPNEAELNDLIEAGLVEKVEG